MGGGIRAVGVRKENPSTRNWKATFSMSVPLKPKKDICQLGTQEHPLPRRHPLGRAGQSVHGQGPKFGSTLATGFDMGRPGTQQPCPPTPAPVRGLWLGQYRAFGGSQSLGYGGLRC